MTYNSILRIYCLSLVLLTEQVLWILRHAKTLVLKAKCTDCTCVTSIVDCPNPISSTNATTTPAVHNDKRTAIIVLIAITIVIVFFLICIRIIYIKLRKPNRVNQNAVPSTEDTRPDIVLPMTEP